MVQGLTIPISDYNIKIK